jgi:hypothetical protein
MPCICIFKVFFSVLLGAFSLGNAIPFVSAIGLAQGCGAVVFSIIDTKPKIDAYRYNFYILSIIDILFYNCTWVFSKQQRWNYSRQNNRTYSISRRFFSVPNKKSSFCELLKFLNYDIHIFIFIFCYRYYEILIWIFNQAKKWQ